VLGGHLACLGEIAFCHHRMQLVPCLAVGPLDETELDEALGGDGESDGANDENRVHPEPAFGKEPDDAVDDVHLLFLTFKTG